MSAKLTSTGDLVGLGVGAPAIESVLFEMKRKFRPYGAMIAVAELADATKQVAMQFVQF